MMKRVAAIQMASGPNLDANLLEAGRLISQAAKSGAGLLVLPESFALVGIEDGDVLKYREQPGEGPVQNFIRAQCRKHQVWIVAGTIPLHCDVPDRMAAACMLFDDRGEMRARYDKIHMFDVTLSSGRSYNESAVARSGDQLVVVDTPFGRLGLVVCYDLRFPEQFRALLDQDMEIIALPAEFTALTGKAHWEILVRARAIENLAYVIASGQGGYHMGGRETYGHSMIVDPWGTIKGQLPHGAGVVLADIDQRTLEEIRRTFPCIHNRQLICEIRK